MTATVLLATVLTAAPLTAAPQAPAAASPAAPLSIGNTFTIQSKVLGEVRRINVYMPPGYDDAPRAPAR